MTNAEVDLVYLVKEKKEGDRDRNRWVILTLAALCACDKVQFVMGCDADALDGLFICQLGTAVG